MYTRLRDRRARRVADRDVQTPLTLSNVSFQTHGFAPECIASIDDSGSGFQYLYNCGDHELQKFLRTGQVGLSITSVVPNPAGASLRVEGRGQRVEGREQKVAAELVDALGQIVIPSTLYPLPFTLDVSALPSGIYFLRISSGGYSVSRSVAIER